MQAMKPLKNSLQFKSSSIEVPLQKIGLIFEPQKQFCVVKFKTMEFNSIKTFEYFRIQPNSNISIVFLSHSNQLFHGKI